MPSKRDIQKALVVLGPGLAHADEPMQSTLIRRAVELARAAGCELELFHVAYNGALENAWFAAEAQVERTRRSMTDADATRLAEIAAWLRAEGVRVRHEVRWDASRIDAILQKVAETKPDFVMKQAREHSYLLGITSNTDWELARRSPAHLWLVNDKVDRIGRIVAAIGNRVDDPGDITSAADAELLHTASRLGEPFGARIHAVNAYELPSPTAYVATVGGAVPPAIPLGDQQKLADEVVARHTGAVQALVEKFDIGQDDVHIREGHPGDVIPDVAESVSADLIVMGARSIGRLERFLNPVTVEPVMSNAECDVLVVREPDPSAVPAARETPYFGSPEYDLERAITYPEDTFDSPQEVASLSGVSTGLRKRILQVWEYDIRAEMAAENEGVPARDIDVQALNEISAAKEYLKMEGKSAQH